MKPCTCVCLRQAAGDDMVRRWLTGVRLERYYQLFAAAGYDLPTVSRMTPEVGLHLALFCGIYLRHLVDSMILLPLSGGSLLAINYTRRNFA